jgi:putative phosphoesterase
MRIAVLADIHGNDLALEAVVRAAQNAGVDRYFILGDLIGYYHRPRRVLQILRSLDQKTVIGNHEQLLGKCMTSREERQKVASALGSGHETAMRELSPEEIDGLLSLPLSVSLECGGMRFTLAHGTATDAGTYIYPDSPKTLFETVRNSCDSDVILLGHTHRAMAVSVSGCLIANPGSVGQPRDGGRDASWALIETATGSVRFLRTPYDAAPIVRECMQRDPNHPKLTEYLAPGTRLSHV